MTLKQSFDFGYKYNVCYHDDCGMCVLSNMSEYTSDNQFISNDDILNDINPDEETYDIILFGSGRYETSFLPSLEWLSLKIANNRSYIISIDNDKTKRLQNTFVDKNIIGNARYYSFGYTKWKNYLMLFGGITDDGYSENNWKAIDSIFYFDFFQMKWYKSLKVL